MPDYRPKGLDQMIKPKCRVVYFPLKETGTFESTHGKGELVFGNKIPVEKNMEEVRPDDSKKVNEQTQKFGTQVLYVFLYDIT